MPKTAKELRKKGAIIGENFNNFAFIDDGHPWLLEVGDNVTLSTCTVLTHDASTKIPLGYSRIGKVKIGNNVFVGANAVILPGVSIGSNVIIGAGSIVNKDIPDNSIACGVPCKVVGKYDDFVSKNRELMKSSPVYNKERSQLTYEDIEKQKKDLGDPSNVGFDL